jgi:predicted DNA-binding antitoxin AbrB/MazE fold protein
MTKNLQAIYENGVLRLLEPVSLPEKKAVTVAIIDETQAESWLDSDYHADCEADTSPEVSLAEVRAALASIPGTMTADFVAERDDR